MDVICMSEACPLAQISWMWYGIAVAVAYLFGMVWYSVFGKPWAAAVRYECPCGANITAGERCTCGFSLATFSTLLLHLVSVALMGLMYFVLTSISIWLSILAVVAVAGWMKTMARFEASDLKRWLVLCMINVGYFFLTSVIFVLFALL